VSASAGQVDRDQVSLREDAVCRRAEVWKGDPKARDALFEQLVADQPPGSFGIRTIQHVAQKPLDDFL
jgi:hypothetical protein